MIADRSLSGLEQTQDLAQQISAQVATVAVDVSKPDHVSHMVDQTVDRFGCLDVLVNAAGVLILTPPLAEVDERHWDAVDHAHGYESDGKTKIRNPENNNPHFPTAGE